MGLKTVSSINEVYHEWAKSRRFLLFQELQNVNKKTVRISNCEAFRRTPKTGSVAIIDRRIKSRTAGPGWLK